MKNLHSITSALLAALALVSATLVVGCAEKDEESTTDEDTATEQGALIGGWTPLTSDGLPPVTCDNGSLVNSFGCLGRYCDDVRLFCYPSYYAGNGVPNGSRYTPYFSEEHRGSALCADDEWMTGVSCTGSYCDNVSLQCTKMIGLTHNHCFWTGWVSEETEALNFGPNNYAVGAQCSGSYCDNMRFYVCQPH